jgi:hypothetical protein
MKTYMVSVSQVVCADLEIEAETEEEARNKVMSSGIDQEEYCEGHRDTRIVNSVELVEHAE